MNQAKNYGLVLKKFHRVIKFNKNAWLKPYIDLNTDLRKNQKKIFKKFFFKSMNSAVLGKTMGNARKHRDIKLFTTERRRKYVVCESNYHTTKFFQRKFISNGMKKTK